MKIILAHRGVIKENKENTLGALRAIKKYKITSDIGFGIEFDINLTLDEQLIIYHDEYLENTTKKITDITYSELKSIDSDIPLLEEVLNEFNKTDYILDIELKEYTVDKIIFCNLFIELVNKYKQLNYFTSSFDKEIIKYFKKKNIKSYLLIDKDDLENNLNILNNDCIIHYSNIEININISKYFNILGVYTLWENNFNSNYLTKIDNIKYLITDNIDKLL